MRMLRSLGWAALGTGFTFLMTTLGAATVFFFSGEPRPKFQKAMLGFAAGVMTAASVWSLLLRGNGVDGLFGGLGYQLWLNVTLKRRMEDQETQ